MNSFFEQREVNPYVILMEIHKTKRKADLPREREKEINERDGIFWSELICLVKKKTKTKKLYLFWLNNFYHLKFNESK